MNSIAKKVIKSRKESGLTQEELAERAKVSLRTIQRIERAETEPRGYTLQLICNVLDIDSKELLRSAREDQHKSLPKKILNVFFIIILNLILISIIGFLTFDSNANINSVFGGFLVSFFLPFFLVYLSKDHGGIERVLKFGVGYIVYFVLVWVQHGFPTGFISGLFPCILVSLTVLHYGHLLIKSGSIKISA